MKRAMQLSASTMRPTALPVPRPAAPPLPQQRTLFRWLARSRSRSRSPRAVSPDAPDATPLARAHARGEAIGFGFSAGGLLFPYYIGVASALTDLGLITPATPLAGASAGSLIAACVASGMPAAEIEGACLALAADCREGGTRGRLGPVLREFLCDHLPGDAHLAARDRVHVAVTGVSSRGPKPVLVSDFQSRDDLIAALLTSCHIPLWMDGRLTTKFREDTALDGGLTAFLPLPPGCHGVGVCCFPSVATLGGWLGPGNLISPDAYETVEGGGGGESDDPFLSLPRLLNYAFTPAPDPVLKSMSVRGDADARAWAAAELGVVAAGAQPPPPVERSDGGGAAAAAEQAAAAAVVGAAGEAAAEVAAARRE